ncbi:Bug family tripartite tricarboxylate transporter substrate binding protein [Plastoroseomonas hellenica]|uniref:Tripartite tricarboxylate transporter substrate binding protein n=1 Tax=Plastoroseomonas hellenica TaxID=2687306 RepID=A0ABS5F6C2_9PROT|nr:tripartite tricarboxylate transporter substrate binding protein [Plastoroseomonas hellenica]MBR0646773.1 tripartite tricarboxylate transporter substrate binding protein [Plastoroseomonas hellenica]MBR0668089.1 tripartite tricarboxylate transporter substrate binding protein [Plastoroseomonas hellenica]
MATRRSLLAGAALLAPHVARAQAAWPDRPLRFVIGGAAGGASDIFLRMMEARLREALGQPLIIDPRPGAGGMVGAEVAAKATPDGYTYYINHIASHGIGPTLYRRLSFDPLRDLPGVARIAFLPNVLIVKGDGPVRSIAELVAFARAHPDRANFSSAGSGTSSHLSGVLFGQRMGVEVTHIPYRGTAPSMAAVLNGEVLFAIDNAPASRQQVLAGMLRALGVSTARRASTMPEIPTLQEQGVPEFDVSSWYGIAAPGAVPRPVIERLGREIVAALNDPAVAQRVRDFGAEPAPLGPAEYDAFMRQEVATWAPIVRASGVTVD